jgi:bifunctional DNase/RNase
MKKIRLEIIGMSYSQLQSGAYALILGETDGNRRLPIIIGGFEAQAIAIELEKMKPARPLTHDLFRSFADVFNIAINEVVINKFVDGVFHARIVCTDGRQEVEIDSRTSDAVALALRFKCPVYTYENIMETAGILMDEKSGEEVDNVLDETLSSPYADNTIEELEHMMNQAIEHEEYEKASIIRDELKRRNPEQP